MDRLYSLNVHYTNRLTLLVIPCMEKNKVEL